MQKRLKFRINYTCTAKSAQVTTSIKQ